MAVRNSVKGEGAEPFMEYLGSLTDVRERYNAMVTVLLHAGKGQAVDEFTLADSGPEFSDGLDPEQRFREYVRQGRVDFSRVHQIDGRFFGFNTEHSVFPYVGSGTREYLIPGVCVSDVRQGRDISRMADVGIGDDSTMVYAGKDPVVDGKRVAALHDRVLPMFKGDEERTARFLHNVEETMYPIFTRRPVADRDVDERRFVGQAKAVMDDWHPNLFPSQRASVREKFAVAVYKSAREAEGIDLNRRRYNGMKM